MFQFHKFSINYQRGATRFGQRACIYRACILVNCNVKLSFFYLVTYRHIISVSAVAIKLWSESNSHAPSVELIGTPRHMPASSSLRISLAQPVSDRRERARASIPCCLSHSGKATWRPPVSTASFFTRLPAQAHSHTAILMTSKKQPTPRATCRYARPNLLLNRARDFLELGNAYAPVLKKISTRRLHKKTNTIFLQHSLTIAHFHKTSFFKLTP